MKIASFQRYCLLLLVIGLGLLLAGLIGGRWLGDTAQGELVAMGVTFAGLWVLMRLMPRWWTEDVSEEYRSAASVRYRRRVLPAMLVYTIAILAVMPVLKGGMIASLPLRALVALLPALPIFFVFLAFLDYVREIDELKRRIELEAVGIGAMIVCLVYFPLSLLQLARVIDVPAGQAMLLVFPLMCLGYGIGKFITMRRYR